MDRRRGSGRSVFVRVVGIATFGAALAGLAQASGCKSDECSAGAKECVSDGIARVCTPDGKAWVTETCAAGSTCADGVCQAVCKAGDAQCADERVALVCAGTPSAFVAVPCRANEKCDQGACKLDPSGLACAPGTKDCATDAIARVCSKDGSEWEHTACAPGFKCDQGDCKFDGAAACTPGTGTCVGDTPFRCKADGSGYDSTPCPSGTTCTGAGLCQGPVCVVGAARCIQSRGFVETCPNGNGWTQTPCASGELCIDANDLSQPNAFVTACKPAACQPGQTACGNPADPAVDVTKAFSTCVPTKAGFAWQKTNCGTFATCSPASPSCSTQCRPGDTTCSSDGKYVMTCGADGKWATTPTTTCTYPKQCVHTNTGTVACGDSACANGVAGQCTADGRVLACDASGTLSTTPTACTTGTCQAGACKTLCADGATRCQTTADGSRGVATCTNGVWPTTLTSVCSTPTDPTKACVTIDNAVAVCGDPACAPSNTTGACTSGGLFRPCDANGTLVAASAAIACPTGQMCIGSACTTNQCQAGETVCATTDAYRTCSGGKWSATTTQCPQADAGFQICTNSTQAGLRTALCGAVCTPGARVCYAPSGSTGSPTALRVCGADGQWSAPQNCTYGACVTSGTNADYCAAQCVPGETVCAGSTTFVSGLNQNGWTASGACTSSGTLPTTIATCSSGLYCRKDDTGKSLGCVECVGGRNGSGLTDTRCSTTSSTSYDTCGSGNTWASGTSTSCNGSACSPPSGSTPAGCRGACSACVMNSCATYSCTTSNCISYKSCASTCSTSSCLSTCYNSYYYVPYWPYYDSQVTSLSSCYSSTCSASCP